ncbi:MAG: hypothetical protein HOC23_04415 [Halieaceae bacterium]|jgi:lipid-binding SYLF domain-containing protein|nr:hypothetical protein [Halieaceae bacterium]
MAVLLLITALLSGHAVADSRAVIDAKSQEALRRLRSYAVEVSTLVEEAVGILVFPDIINMRFGNGGQYGEGSLLVAGEPREYYVEAGAPFGLQSGAQYKSEVILFLTPESLADFRNTRGWEVGVNARVEMIEPAFDTADSQIQSEVVGFIFSNRGLVYNLTLEGNRITRVAK